MALKKTITVWLNFNSPSKIPQIGRIHLKFGHFLPAATLGAVVIDITLGVKEVRSTDLAPHFVLFGPSNPILEVKEVKLFRQFVIPPSPVRSFCL